MSASIIKNRNFAFMWFGHLISHAGDAVFMIALPWLMLDITGSKSLTSLVSMSAYLPAALFGLGGVLVRYNPKGDLRLIAYLCIISLIIHPLITLTISSTFFTLQPEVFYPAVIMLFFTLL